MKKYANTNSVSAIEAKNKLENYCARKEHTVKECMQKLMLWGIDETESVEIINYLTTNKYIDHQRFAHAFVNDKSKFNHWGKNKIQIQLRIKGIENQYIEEALKSIEPEIQTDVLKVLLEKKMSTIPPRSSLEIKSKLYRYAVSKGFESELVLKILDQLIPYQ